MTLATKNRLVRRSGRRRDESDAPSTERGRKVEPKAVRNKGIFRVGPNAQDAANAFNVGRREIVGKSRQSRRRSKGEKRKIQLSPADERSRRRRSTRTAEPRVERRSNRKSRSRSPPPVPTRVSTIKYLLFNLRKNRGKFYAISLFPTNDAARFS